MEKIVLPCTLKEIHQLKQAYIEKYFRHYIKKRLTQFIKDQKNLSPVKENEDAMEEGESEVFRFVKQLTSEYEDAEKITKVFYKHFCSSESAVVAMYEEVVNVDYKS